MLLNITLSDLQQYRTLLAIFIQFLSLLKQRYEFLTPDRRRADPESFVGVGGKEESSSDKVFFPFSLIRLLYRGERGLML